MAGTIVADIIQSDQSYASSINIASPMVVSNTLTMGSAAAISGNVNFDSGTLFVDSVNNRVGVGTNTSDYKFAVQDSSSGGTRVNVINNNNATPGSGIFLQTFSGGSQVSSSTIRVNNSGIFSIFNGASSETENLRIDASGRVTKPLQPAFLAFMDTAGGSYTFPTSDAKLSFTSSIYNIGSNFNTSTGRFTAPVDGIYQFCFISSITAMSNHSYNAVLPFVNGATSSSINFRMRANSYNDGGWAGYTSAFILKLNANDYVELYCYSDLSSVLTVSKNETSWSGYLVA